MINILTLTKNICKKILGHPNTQHNPNNTQTSIHPAFIPLESLTIKELYKEKYTSGCEYFVFTGTMYKHRNIAFLLKAFSIFKQWQQSNMKLLLAGNIDPKDFDPVLDKISTYKYKNDIVIIDTPKEEELALIIGSAYGFIMPSLKEDDIMPILNAMNCGVPVIASDIPIVRQYCGDAALYVNPNDIKSIADQMILLYKDEKLHHIMTEKIKTSLTHST